MGKKVWRKKPCLPFEHFAKPVFDAVPVDVFLHLLHFPLIRQNDNHGGVAFVGNLDDRGGVIPVMVEVIAPISLHHVHSHLSVLIHMEVGFVSLIYIEGLLPFT